MADAATDALIQQALRAEEAEKKLKKQGKHVEGAPRRPAGPWVAGCRQLAGAAAAAAANRPAACPHQARTACPPSSPGRQAHEGSPQGQDPGADRV